MTTPPNELYRRIPLTRGQFAIVDATDYDWLAQWKWFAQWNPKTRSFYAGRNSPPAGGKRHSILMHREILGLEFGDQRKGDHRCHNTTDNRRANLRIASNLENGRNVRIRRNNTTGVKGVYIARGRYQAAIRAGGKTLHLGSFFLNPSGLKAASETYAFAADLYFGDFAFIETSLGVSQEGVTLENYRSQRVQRVYKTGYRGVVIYKAKRYCARIHLAGRTRHLGYFPLTEEGFETAKKAYQLAELLS